jgi:hypothetical protein
VNLPRALARPTVAVATFACLGAVTLSGCNDVSGTATRSATEATSPAPTAPATTVGADDSPAPATVTPTTTTTTTSAAPSPSEPTSSAPAGVGGLRSRLLDAADVPGFNDGFRWAEGRTGSQEPSTPVGTCQRFAMTSIGATHVAVRDYRPVSGGSQDHATELVAEFPDSTTARRAFAVLKAWRAQCADRLKRYKTARIGKLEDVGVDGGSGGWYLLTYGPVGGDPDTAFFDAQGMAVVGTRIAVMEMVLAGQDYNYEPGQEPMVAAVQRAAARLG